MFTITRRFTAVPAKLLNPIANTPTKKLSMPFKLKLNKDKYLVITVTMNYDCKTKHEWRMHNPKLVDLNASVTEHNLPEHETDFKPYVNKQPNFGL